MNQSQREAILDLLILSLYADSHISLIEEGELQADLQSLGWESPRPRDIYFCNSLRRARDAGLNEETLSIYIDQKTAFFDSRESKAEALSYLSKLVHSDGESEAEKGFMAQIQSALAKD